MPSPGSRTLRHHAGQQLRSLCEEFDLEDVTAGCVRLLYDLLGNVGSRPISEPVLWPSFVVDDHTPVEFSLAFDSDGSPTLRILVEHLAPEATARKNLLAARRLTERLAQRYQLPLDRFEAIADLFLPDEPQGRFSLWHAVVLRPNGRHEFKVYFNPAVRGADRAPDLVAQALRRLGFAHAHDTVVAHAFRPGSMSDRFAFLALDLRPGPRSRVKVYVAHHCVRAVDIERAARAARGVLPGLAKDFCQVVGGPRVAFTRRPLVSCYAFVSGVGDVPSGYALHLPIRDYVADDEVARGRATALLKCHGADPSVLDRALKIMAERPLDAGVGLISYVSLRMGQLRPGITVYLSSEAYGMTPKPAGRPS
jgi:DMATS type aromatic prenyltransferase